MSVPPPESNVQMLDVEDLRALSKGDRHAPLLLGLGIKILGNRREAEDLVHDVFLELWREAPRYDQARGGVRGWILSKTRSRALDRRLQWARRKRAVDPLLRGESSYVTDDRIGSERRALREAFEQLPPSQRTVLELVYAEGLSTLEVAAHLGSPVGTVKSRIAYGLARLRASLRVPSAAARVGPPRSS